MSQAILHFLIPLLTLRLLKFNKKLVLSLSFLSVIQDLDFFIFLHRATFHNLFVGATLVLTSILVLKKYHKKMRIIFVGSFFFLSHLFLDKVVAWLYPLIKINFGFSDGKFTTVTIESMQLYKPNFSLEFKLFQIIGLLLVFSLLLLEIKLTHKKGEE